MKAWKKLEEFVAEYLSSLGWVRKKKKHFGDSIWDVEGQGYKGDCKHYKAHKIHTIKNETDLKYKDDCLIFTKVKRTHYLPSNVFVTISLKQLESLLKCKRIAEKVDIDNKDVKSVDNMLTNNLNSLSFRINICKDTLRAMDKIVKELQETQQEIWVND